jgi:excisionase family DNA binding protein
MREEIQPETNLRNESEAARYLKISRQTIIRLRRAGLIGFYRIRRRVLYGQEHLNAFLASAQQQSEQRAVISGQEQA